MFFKSFFYQSETGILGVEHLPAVHVPVYELLQSWNSNVHFIDQPDSSIPPHRVLKLISQDIYRCYKGDLWNNLLFL